MMDSLTKEIERLRTENEGQRRQIEKYREFNDDSRGRYDVLYNQYKDMFEEHGELTSTFTASLRVNEVRIEQQDKDIVQLRQQLEEKSARIKALEMDATTARNGKAAAEEAWRAAESAQKEAMTKLEGLEIRLQTLESEKWTALQELERSQQQKIGLDQRAEQHFQDMVNANKEKMLTQKEMEQMRQEKQRIKIKCRHLEAGFRTALKLWYEWTRTLSTMANERADYLMKTLDTFLNDGSRNQKRWNYFVGWRSRQSLRQCVDLDITDEIASRLIFAYFICNGLDGKPEWAEQVEWSELPQCVTDTSSVQLRVDDGSATHEQNAYHGPSQGLMLAFREFFGLQLNNEHFIQLGYFDETEHVKRKKGWDVHTFRNKDRVEKLREDEERKTFRSREAEEAICSGPEVADGAADQRGR